MSLIRCGTGTSDTLYIQLESTDSLVREALLLCLLVCETPPLTAVQRLVDQSHLSQVLWGLKPFLSQHEATLPSLRFPRF